MTTVEDILFSGLDVAYRSLSGDSGTKTEDHSNTNCTDGGDHGDGHSAFGVHIVYEDLYKAVVFFAAIYVAGAVFSKILKMPSLVGEIFAGIVLGPPLLEFVPNAEAFVLLGEIGLILLVLEAGIDIDLTTLKLIGTRGVIIAVIGSILPVGFAFGIALFLKIDMKGAIAAGACFGPTSLGIAMNILRQGKIVNTPVGQLIVSAAVIDDMIALVILSQLAALTGEVSVSSIVIPIASAIAFLVLGGYICVALLPGFIDKFLHKLVPEEHHPQASLTIMMSMVLGLMPACKYGEASYLMGVFISGLTFCRDHEVHHLFVSQFKRLLQWLMRIFFAASIGFQVPFKDFGNKTVILQGLIFTLALTGKLAVGFLVPNFNRTPRFTGLHLRDCLVTGFSMAAEGEFAFVIAVYAVTENLIGKDLYASIVLAVLISTIVPPFLLRFTISYYNNQTQKLIEASAKVEFDRKMDIDSVVEAADDVENQRHDMLNETTVFLCIQTQSRSRWGLLPAIMGRVNKLELDIIDHRSWHPRGVDTTLVNEIYAKGSVEATSGNATVTLEGKIDEIEHSLLTLLAQEDAQVKVQRWFPGVLSEIVEEVVNVRSPATLTQSLSVSDKIAHEASQMLEKKRQSQTTATVNKSVEDILRDANANLPDFKATQNELGKPRRRRVKMRSTPVLGGDMFGGGGDTKASGSVKRGNAMSVLSKSTSVATNSRFGGPNTPSRSSSYVAEIVVGKESFNIHISGTTLARLRKQDGGSFMNDSDVQTTANISQMEYNLQGFVRMPLSRIEELSDSSRPTNHLSGDDVSQASA